MRIRHEIVAVWEDPSQSQAAGANQVAKSDMTGEGMLCVYGWQASLSQGQRINMLTDFKALLDALEVPYAFGALQGDPDSIVFCIGPEHIGWPVLDCLGDMRLSITCKAAPDHKILTFSEPMIIDGPDGAPGLHPAAASRRGGPGGGDRAVSLPSPQRAAHLYAPVA